MIKPESKLVFCYFGNGIALGAYGTKEQISHDLDGLFNWCGHDDETSFLSDTFGYVLTSKEQLAHGFSNIIMAGTFSTEFNAPRGIIRRCRLVEARNKADEEAKAFVAQIPLENFLGQGNPEVNEYPIPFK